VALNEISSLPYPFLFFRRMRRRIRRGLPVPNKYDAEGELTTNTINEDTHIQERRVEVGRRDYVLAHKYGTPHLNRLREFVDGGWEVYVMVRHPLFTLASWKRCPPHFTITQLNPPAPVLAHIRFSSDDLDVRRVEVWNHFAREIDALRDKLHVVRYEDLISDLSGTIARFCERYALEVPSLAPLESRNRSSAYEHLDERLAAVVREHCDSFRFGYNG
jgi:hypothetical protein